MASIGFINIKKKVNKSMAILFILLIVQKFLLNFVLLLQVQIKLLKNFFFLLLI